MSSPWELMVKWVRRRPAIAAMEGGGAPGGVDREATAAFGNGGREFDRGAALAPHRR